MAIKSVTNDSISDTGKNFAQHNEETTIWRQGRKKILLLADFNSKEQSEKH